MILLIFSQLRKASLLIFVIVSGIVIFTKPLQSAYVYSLISVTELATTISVRPVRANALASIAVTESGIAMLVSDSQL